jgi:hypothetical protein
MTGSSFIEMEATLDGRIASGDFSGVPTTDDQEPVIIFWKTEVSFSELSLESYDETLGQLQSNPNPVGVFADSPEGMLQMTMRDPLVPGVHCFVSRGASLAAGEAPAWCFRVPAVVSSL